MNVKDNIWPLIAINKTCTLTSWSRLESYNRLVSVSSRSWDFRSRTHPCPVPLNTMNVLAGPRKSFKQHSFSSSPIPFPFPPFLLLFSSPSLLPSLSFFYIRTLPSIFFPIPPFFSFPFPSFSPVLLPSWKTIWWIFEWIKQFRCQQFSFRPL